VRAFFSADALRQHAYGAKEFAFIDINGYYIRVTEAYEPGHAGDKGPL
jgi:hypothetical protein